MFTDYVKLFCKIIGCVFDVFNARRTHMYDVALNGNKILILIFVFLWKKICSIYLSYW